MIERHMVKKGSYHNVRVDFYGPNTVVMFDDDDEFSHDVTLDKEQAMEVIKLLSDHFLKECADNE